MYRLCAKYHVNKILSEFRECGVGALIVFYSQAAGA